MDKRSSLGISIKLVYILIYLIPIVGSVLFMIFDWKDREIRLHALQALYMAAAVILANIILGLFAMIPYIGAFFSVLIWMLYILYVIIMLVGLARALNDSILKIPLFYDAAARGSI